MSRTHKLTALAATFAITGSGTAIAVPATGSPSAQRQPTATRDQPHRPRLRVPGT